MMNNSIFVVPIIFFAGLLSTFSVEFIGHILFSELLLVLLFPILIFCGYYRHIALVRLFLLVFALSIFVFISDVLNESLLKDLLRGQALIWSFFFQLAVLLPLFIVVKEKLYVYLIGIVSGLIISGYMDLGLGFFNTYGLNSFKFYMAPILFFSFLAYSLFYGRSLNSRVLLLISVGLTLFMFFSGARSDAIILSASVLLAFFFTGRVSVRFVVVVMLMFYLIYLLMVWLFLNYQVGGENMSQLTLVDNVYNPFGLIKVGRLDVYVLWEFFKKSPLIGHGTWAVNESDLYLEYRELVYGVGVDSETIRAHSILFGFLAYSGIFAGLVILYFYYIFFRRYCELMRVRLGFGLRLGISVLIVYALWNLFFSPIGHFRTTAPFCFALIYCFYFKYCINKNNVSLVV